MVNVYLHQINERVVTQGNAIDKSFKVNSALLSINVTYLGNVFLNSLLSILASLLLQFCISIFIVLSILCAGRCSPEVSVFAFLLSERNKFRNDVFFRTCSILLASSVIVPGMQIFITFKIFCISYKRKKVIIFLHICKFFMT